MDADCDHEGQLEEVAELREVRCAACHEMWPLAEKHFAAQHYQE